MNLCLRCRRRLRTCLCERISPFETESRFILLTHPMEFKKEKVGTGRFTHLILKNSVILIDVSFDHDSKLRSLLTDPDYESYLLYPGDETINLSGEDAHFQLNSKKKLQFVVIDGTWSCAKKMMKLTTAIHHLPRVSFVSERQSQFKVKHQPLPGCLSTVESVHQVITDLNRIGREHTAGREQNLMDVFNYTVDQQIAFAQDPALQGYRKKPFSLPGERAISKKWNKRLLFFRGEGG